MANQNYKQIISQMKTVAKNLIPYSFPKVPTFEKEQEVLVLKQRVIKVDGYEFIVCLSHADYRKYIQESLQIRSVHEPFLPFSLVCKVGRMFMGRKYLAHTAFFNESKRIYCWMVKRSYRGKALFPGKWTKPESYEGFEYRIFPSGTIDLH